MEIQNSELIIHLTKFKAVIVPLNNIVISKKRIKQILDFHFLKFNTIIEIGNENNFIYPLFFGFVINYLLNYSEWIVKSAKPYMTIKSSVLIKENTSILNIYSHGVLVFNFITILIVLFSSLLEKFLYAIKSRKRKQY